MRRVEQLDSIKPKFKTIQDLDWEMLNDACYLLVNILSSAVGGKNLETAKATADIINEIFEQCNAQQISSIMSATLTEGNYTGTTLCYLLMGALFNAIKQNNTSTFLAIQKTIKELFKKCNAQQISAMMSATVTAPNDWKDTTPCYWLMATLHPSIKKGGGENFLSIQKIIEELLEKCDAEQIKGMMSVKTRVRWWQKSTVTPFQKFMQLLESDINVNGNALGAKTLILKLLVRLGNIELDKDMLEEILFYKEILRRPLTDFLTEKKDDPALAAMCATDTLLGRLIDHHTSSFHAPNAPTQTRLLVNQFLAAAALPVGTVACPVTGTISTELPVMGTVIAELLEEIAPITAEPLAPPPPSYQAAMSVRMKITADFQDMLAKNPGVLTPALFQKFESDLEADGYAQGVHAKFDEYIQLLKKTASARLSKRVTPKNATATSSNQAAMFTARPSQQPVQAELPEEIKAAITAKTIHLLTKKYPALSEKITATATLDALKAWREALKGTIAFQESLLEARNTIMNGQENTSAEDDMRCFETVLSELHIPTTSLDYDPETETATAAKRTLAV